MDFNEIDLSRPGADAKTSVAAESAQAEATPAVAEAVTSEAAPVSAEVSAQNVIEKEVTERVTETLHKRDIVAIAPELASPQAIGVRNSEIAAAVKEAVQSAMAAIVPALEKLNQPTPLEAEQQEQIARNRARAKREALAMKQQDEETRANLLAKQKACSHLDQNSHEALQLNRNWPDKAPRAICARCNLLVTPKQYICPFPPLDLENVATYSALLVKEGWRNPVPYVDPKSKQITHWMVDEHPLYYRVRELLSREAMALAG